MKTEARLAELGLTLPAVSAPAGLYVPAKRVGNLLYLSGQTPDVDGVTQPQYVGAVGRDLDVETAAKGAELAALNLLAVLKHELGSLDRVRQIVQVLGYVRSAPGFDLQPKVINGASALFRELWGEAGVAARMALGTNELPEGACVEICLIAEIDG